MSATSFVIIAELLFIVVAIGGRNLIHHRRFGRSGIVSLRSDSSPIEKFASATALAGFIAIPAGAVLDIADIWAARNSPTGVVVGAAILMAVGVGVTVHAQLVMGASWRIGVDPTESTDLIDQGIFGLVRNPIYVGIVAFLIGAWLIVPHPITALGVGLLVASIEVQTRAIEEPHLLTTNGDQYREYASRVGRFVPGFGHLGTTMPKSHDSAD